MSPLSRVLFPVVLSLAAFGTAVTAAPAADPGVGGIPVDRYRVQVRGVSSLADLARVVRLFQGAAGAEGVALRAVRGDLALIELSGGPGPDEVDRAAREGGLEPEAAPPAAGGQGSFDRVRLRYRVMQ